MHVHGVQNFVSGEVKDVHVVRLRFSADRDLEKTAALQEAFQYGFTKGEFKMTGIVDISETKEKHVFDVKVCMYVCMVIPYTRVWINWVRLPILLVVG